MTERLAETTRRIGNVGQMETVVTAMRGISASRVQQAHGALRGVHAHATVIARAIGQALSLAPPADTAIPAHGGRSGIILFCAEQGFAGSFNHKVLAEVTPRKDRQDLFLIGTRGLALAAELGVRPVWHAAMVPHANLVPVLAGRVADALYDWVSRTAGARVDVVFPTWNAGKDITVIRRALLPFDFHRFAVKPNGQPPLTTLPIDHLLSRLAEEYVFAELCEAALTSFATENEARAATMLATKGNLENMLSDLRALERQIRQEEITNEIVELALSTTAGTN